MTFPKTGWQIARTTTQLERGSVCRHFAAVVECRQLVICWNEAMHAPMFILSCDGEILGVDTPGNRDLVRRIHACVAACEGLTTEELERGIVADMRNAIEQVVPLLVNRPDVGTIEAFAA